VTVKSDSHAAVLHIGIPNPMFEGEINLYVIAADPLTLIDTGIGTPEAWEALEGGLASHGLSVEKVGQVILTHKHADHFGQANKVHQQSGAPVYIHEDDWEGVADLDARHAEFIPLVIARLRHFHTPEAEIEALSKQLDHGRRFAEQTPAQRISDGHTFMVSGAPLEVIHTPGHTQGSICLRYGNTLFSGDHVLPKISPNIGAGEMRRRGMMQRFLDSLDRIARYQTDDITVLPGHGSPFSNLAERAAELKAHHMKRQATILEALKTGEPKTVYEVARALWSRLPGYHLNLAANEVNAHLEKACDDGVVLEEAGRFRLA
jgi:glyoxylase-like metal-dependent hydrolase (beta-lactamase superfamily II)